MWFKVLKTFGHHKVGDLIELKEDGQHEILADKGLVKESKAPAVEKEEAAKPDTYSTESILKTDVKEAGKAKKEVKK